ncbi:MAG: hypothetical protein R3F38_16520 [Gammaproteobacteria bacterium]
MNQGFQQLMIRKVGSEPQPDPVQRSADIAGAFLQDRLAHRKPGIAHSVAPMRMLSGLVRGQGLQGGADRRRSDEVLGERYFVSKENQDPPVLGGEPGFRLRPALLKNCIRIWTCPLGRAQEYLRISSAAIWTSRSAADAPYPAGAPPPRLQISC